MKKSALSVAFASKTDSNWLTDVTSATETAAGEQRRSQKSLQSFFIQPDAWNVPCRTLTRHFCTRGGSEAKKNHRVMNKNSGRNNDSCRRRPVNSTKQLLPVMAGSMAS